MTTLHSYKAIVSRKKRFARKRGLRPGSKGYNSYVYSGTHYFKGKRKGGVKKGIARR